MPTHATFAGHTRSGKAFSPYEIIVGEPILAPTNFNTGAAIFEREADPLYNDPESDHEVGGADELAEWITSLPPPRTSKKHATLASNAPSIPGQPPATRTKNQKSSDRKRARRRIQRAAAAAEAGSALKGCAQKHRSQAAKDALKTTVNYERDFLKTSMKPCWTARQEKEQEKRTYTLKELQGLGMRLIEWDGRECRPLVDSEGRVFGILAGMPKGEGWAEVGTAAAEAFETARLEVNVPLKLSDHRRGRFPALAVGISHGGGQTEPSVLQNYGNSPALAHLVNETSLQRIAGFTDCVFETFAPRLRKYYSDTFTKLQKKNPCLTPVFPRTAFSACTINLGPQTVSYPHRDYANLNWGLCAVTALGSYNPDEGGHIVLWDLNLIIRFPPGSTVIIPSVLIRHSNASISETEMRYSFAQYSAGGLFRWVDNGFQTEEAWLAKATAADLQKRNTDKKIHWAKGLEMLSLLGELKVD